MSRPGRRPSAAVYRRRRLGALVIAVLVVAALAWGISAVARKLGGPQIVAAPVPAPTGSGSPTGPGSPTDPEGCEAGTVDVTVAGAPAPAEVGQGVTFDVVVSNAGERACLLDASPSFLVVTVSSGPDTVWSSGHCADEAERRLLLDAGATHEVPVQWAGTRSAPGCPGGQPVAGAGTYRVAVTTGGGAAPAEGGAVFTLGRR